MRPFGQVDDELVVDVARARASRDPMARCGRLGLRPEDRRIPATPMPADLAARMRAGERVVFAGVIHNATEAECFPWQVPMSEQLDLRRRSA